MASRVEGAEFKFEFPKVPSGYVPSGQSGSHAVRWLTAFMGVSSPIAAALLALAQCLVIAVAGCAIGLFFAAAALVKPLAFILGLLTALVFVPLGLLAVAGSSFFVPSILTPIAVSAARRGHCRNSGLVKRAMLMSACATSVLYTIGIVLLWDWQRTTQPSSVQAWHVYVIIGWLVVVWIGIALGHREAAMNLELTPYCEHCGRYMEKQELGYGTIESEGAAMALLREPQFTDLHAHFAEESRPKHLSYLGLHVWTCSACSASAVIELETELLRTEQKQDGTTKESTERRRVYSARIVDDEAAELHRVFDLARPDLRGTPATRDDDLAQPA